MICGLETARKQESVMTVAGTAGGHCSGTRTNTRLVLAPVTNQEMEKHRPTRHLETSNAKQSDQHKADRSSSRSSISEGPQAIELRSEKANATNDKVRTKGRVETVSHHCGIVDGK